MRQWKKLFESDCFILSWYQVLVGLAIPCIYFLSASHVLFLTMRRPIEAKDSHLITEQGARNILL